jgi:prepilin-type N-terminal cleavage/methylation domain-containing protein
MRLNQAGVTLTEAMVVVSIVGLLAVAALPFVGSAIGDSKARGAAEHVMSAFRTARQNAVSAAATYQVTILAGVISVTCTNNNPIGNVCPANRAPDWSTQIAEGVVLTPSATPFQFTPTGGATAGTVAVAYGSVTPWQVAVNITGRVRAGLSVCS